MEMTLVLLKPDCRHNKHIGEVISRFEKSGFEICGFKMFQFSIELLRIHYEHITHLPVFPKLVDYMRSSPIVAVALKGEDCINRIRNLVGPTDSKKATKGTIRGDFGEDSMKNVVHASDSKKSAEVELKRFFREDEIFAA